MAYQESNQLHYQDALRQLARDLTEAAHGTKGDLKKAFMKIYGVSSQTLHRHINELGFKSGRKQRSDAGTTSVSEETLLELAAMKRLGVRENGKDNQKTTMARSVLMRNGRNIQVGSARLNQLLRDRGLNVTTLTAASVHKNTRSLYPNHVHQVDPSYSLLYYAPDGVKKLNDSEAYKNKPGWVKKTGANKLWRYVLTDHYSSTIICKYYKSAGETQAILWDFVQYCWQKTEGRLFHGVPEILILDKGSAGMAGGFGNAMRYLQVDLEPHCTGNSRAKGQVEKANDIIEMMFESGLLHEPIVDVDMINAAVWDFCNAYNANAIPNYDSSLNRPGLVGRVVARSDIFSRIRSDQIRYLPDADMCRYLFTNDPVEKQVRPDLSVSFKHPSLKRTCLWNLRHVTELAPKQIITIEPLINTNQQQHAPQILISVTNYQNETTTYIAEPVQYDEHSGFALDGPVFGEEYKELAESPVDKNLKKVDRNAYQGMDDEQIKKARKAHQQPFADKGGLVTHSDLKDLNLPHYLQREGEQIDVPNRMQVEEKPLDSIDVALTLKRKYGVAMDADKNSQIDKWYPDGVFETDIENLAKRLNEQPSLKVVGGKE